MHAFMAVAVVLGSAWAVRAEEAREWDVRGLTIEEREDRAVGIGFRPGESGHDEHLATTADEVAEWLRSTVNPDGWDNSAKQLECHGGVIQAVASKEEIAEIDQLIAELKARASRTVELEIEIVEVDAAAASGLVPGPLEDPAAEALRTAARDVARGRLLARLVARSRGGEHGQASSVRRRTYVADYDIEIAQHATAADPVVRSLAEGALLEFRPNLSASGESLTLEILLQTARLAGMAAFSLPAASGGPIDLPRMDCSELRTCVAVTPGKTVLLAATDFRPATAGRTTLILARTRIDGAALKPADPGPAGDVFRSWNVSALLNLPASSIHPPRLGLPEPHDDASASDPCPICSGERQYRRDTIADWVRRQTGDAVWEEPGRNVTVLGDQLVVHAPAEAQEAIAKALAGAELLLGSNVTLETWLVAFPEPEWLSRRDVLERPKGIPEALFDELIQLPAKGAARLVASSSALGLSGSPLYAIRGRCAAYVADHDVEIADSAKAWDPVVNSMNDGFLLSAGVLPAAEGLLRVGLESGLAEASLDAALATGADSGGVVQNPSCDMLPLECDVQVPDGRGFVAATAVRDGAKGREVWVYFVRARTPGEK